jgi:predicted RNA-binding protein YlxR (DUF448 family)
MQMRMPDHEAVRRCVITGERRPRGELIRLVLAPDGRVTPDLLARAPGRGAWVLPDARLIDSASRNGRLRKAVVRHLEAEGAAPGGVQVPEGLAQEIQAGLKRRALERLGLENRAGNLIFGSDRIMDAASAGGLRLLLHAEDSAEDGRAKLSRALGRSPHAREIMLPVTRVDLSLALGRQNVVHAATCDVSAADRMVAAVDRWRVFCGSGGDEVYVGDPPRTP